MAPKNSKINPKKFKFYHPPPYKYASWFELKSLSYQFIFTFLTHTISSLNSSKIEDQMTRVFLDVMDEVMNILEAEEAMVAAASSST
jgi:hypothetical protein